MALMGSTEWGASALGGLVTLAGFCGKIFSKFMFSWMCHIQGVRVHL